MDNSVEKLNDHLKEIQKDPAALINQPNAVAHYLPDHGSQIAQTVANASGYLNSLRPNEQKAQYFDNPPVVNPHQKQEFNRALQIANNPLQVMEDIKNGTIVPKDITHLSALFPKAYDSMKVALLDKISTHPDPSSIPYKTKMALSLFLGHPLDSTLTPQSIQNLQSLNSQVASQQNDQSKGQATKKGTSHLGDLATLYKTPLQKTQSRDVE